MRVAAIQATPVILDAEGCVDEGGAAARTRPRTAGAQLAVLPECFIPLYPSNAGRAARPASAGWDELWERLWANSVDVPGPLLDRLVEVCRERELFCVIGVNERESERPGTLYNTLVYLGPSGLLARHRKLMPTQHERLFHGIGAGDDLAVVDAAGARVGGLICWENRMPLARYAVYRAGPQIWVAPTADDSDGWLASMRHIAIESGAFVVSVPQFIPAAAFPDDFPVPLPADKEVFGRGGAAVIEPSSGEVIAGPLYGEEGIVDADCDLRRGLHAKRWFDAVGHYSREDVLGARDADAGERRLHELPLPRGLRAGSRTASTRAGSPTGSMRSSSRTRSSTPTTGPSSSGWTCSSSPRPTPTGGPSAPTRAATPGFVRVLDERTVAFPNYDGNGMYLSMGNLLDNPHVGMLFIDFVSARPVPAATQRHRQHRRARRAARRVPRRAVHRPGSRAPRCSRTARATSTGWRSSNDRDSFPAQTAKHPIPDWKRSDWACDVLPAGDPARPNVRGHPV